jgi:putative transposase
VEIDFSRPGKPTDNAHIEAFNARLRAECVNASWFLSIADARERLEAWRREYCRASQHPSGYVVENGRAFWPGGGPAGWFGFFLA